MNKQRIYVDMKAPITGGKQKHVEFCHFEGSTNRDRLYCHICETSERVAYPIPIDAMVTLLNAFVEKHDYCCLKI